MEVLTPSTVGDTGVSAGRLILRPRCWAPEGPRGHDKHRKTVFTLTAPPPNTTILGIRFLHVSFVGTQTFSLWHGGVISAGLQVKGNAELEPKKESLRGSEVVPEESWYEQY